MDGHDSRTGPGLGMPRAIAFSLVFHALLLLLLMALPTSGPSAETVREETITFTFEPEPEPSSQPSELFKVIGDPPEESSDSTPPPSVLSVPREAALQPVPPSREPAEPVEGEETDDQPENPVEEPVEEMDEPKDSEEEGEPGVRDLPERTGGRIRSAEEPAERRLDVRSAVDRTTRSVLMARRSATSHTPEHSGSPRGMELPELDRLPESGFGYGNLVFESTDFDFDEYARQIYMAIWRAWHKRLYLSTDEFDRWAYARESWLLDHQLQIRFTIHGNGQVDGIVIEDDSGCIPLDRSAADALQEVILPPLPDNFPRDRETVRARFIGQGDIRALKNSLAWLKSRGEF